MKNDRVLFDKIADFLDEKNIALFEVVKIEFDVNQVLIYTGISDYWVMDY